MSQYIPIRCTRNDGKINDGVYVAYEWIAGGELCRMYIGTRTGGPMLQYDADGSAKWDGLQHRDFKRGAWTPCYSRGDFGRRYACGGHWSGHTSGLCGGKQHDTDLGNYMVLDNGPVIDVASNGDVLMADNLINVDDLPGIKGDIHITSLDCSIAWAMWYATAAEALHARLTHDQIQASDINLYGLPQKTKIHLALNEDGNVVNSVREVINAHNI